MTDIQKCDKIWCLALIASVTVWQISTITAALADHETESLAIRDAQWRSNALTRLPREDVERLFEWQKEAARRVGISGSPEALAIGLMGEATG